MKSYGGEGYVFAVLGPALVMGCSYWLWATLRFRREAVRAAGVVVANEKSGGRYGSESSPRFRFRTPDGREWEVESTVSTRPAVFRLGEPVTVLYRPENPAGAVIESVSQLWLLPVTGVIAGLVFSALAWVTLRS